MNSAACRKKTARAPAGAPTCEKSSRSKGFTLGDRACYRRADEISRKAPRLGQRSLRTKQTGGRANRVALHAAGSLLLSRWPYEVARCSRANALLERNKILLDGQLSHIQKVYHGTVYQQVRSMTYWSAKCIASTSRVINQMNARKRNPATKKVFSVGSVIP